MGREGRCDPTDPPRAYDAPMGPAPIPSWLAATSLIVLANGPLFFIERRLIGVEGTWEGPVMQPTLILTIGSGFVLAAAGLRRPVAAVPLVAAIAFGLWAMASTWWSLQPDVSLWRGALYVAMPGVAWVVAGLDFPHLTRALGAALTALVGVSLALVVLWPTAALDRNDDWRGLMTNRNGFAPLCGLAVIVAVALIAQHHRAIGGLLLGLGVVGLVGSGSRTAWFALLIALGVATVAALARKRPGLAVGLALVEGAGVSYGVGRLWNEPTFVQRRTIWDLVGDHAATARWHGVGWEAFWYTPRLHTDPLLERGSAHGSIPELLLGLGVVGLVLWLVVAGSAVVGATRAIWHRPGTEAWMWAALTTFLLVENLTESFVLWFSYNWLLLMVVALRLGPGPRTTHGHRIDAPSALVSA